MAVTIIGDYDLPVSRFVVDLFGEYVMVKFDHTPTPNEIEMKFKDWYRNRIIVNRQFEPTDEDMKRITLVYENGNIYRAVCT